MTTTTSKRVQAIRGLLAEAVVVPEVAGVTRQITALTPDPSRAGAVRVMLDRTPFGAVAREDVDAAHLVVGMPVDDALLARLHTAADAEAATRTALAALSRRSHARAELGRRLRRRGHAQDAVATALDRLARMGLLDDAAFARWFAETKTRKGCGPARIARDLGVLGVPRELASAALAALAPADGEPGDVVRRLAEARFRQLSGLEPRVQRQRLLGFLARRGYTGGLVGQIVRDVVAGA